MTSTDNTSKRIDEILVNLWNSAIKAEVKHFDDRIKELRLSHKERED